MFSAYTSPRKKKGSSKHKRDIPYNKSNKYADISSDVDSYKEQLFVVKKKNSELQSDNTYLQIQVQKLNKQLKKRDEKIFKILDSKVQNSDDTNIIEEIKHLKHEFMSITTLTSKLRETENALVMKEKEIKELKSSIKAITIRELQIENETYFNESKKLLKQVRKLQSQLNEESRMELLREEAVLNNEEEKVLLEKLEQLKRENGLLKQQILTNNNKQQRDLSSLTSAVTQTLDTVKRMEEGRQQAELLIQPLIEEGAQKQ